MESHPELAGRDCEECKKYVFDMKSGEIMVREDGTPEPRAKGTLNCADCPKHGVEELTASNLHAYLQYVTCKELGGALPQAGGLNDQEPYLMRKFQILAMMDRQRQLAYQHIKLSMPPM